VSYIDQSFGASAAEENPELAKATTTDKMKMSLFMKHLLLDDWRWILD
jgi:hypothetical protein